MSAATPDTEGLAAARAWPLWEVFIRPARGLSHTHAGSLHAADERMAIANARDLYTRRSEGVSIWVVRSADLTASSPDEKDALFDPAGDKIYRYPTFFTASEGVPGL
ncbi:MAG: 1,2-phenylacetyl-CoA epoxidase subunit PaaB [Nakamurella sp.]